jgi:hypothetical protein
MKKTIALAIALALALSVVAAVIPPDDVTVNMDVVAGAVDIKVNGVDGSAWHPGSIGETNEFVGLGGFVGTYKATEGNYGSLNSFVNVNSYASGANFVLTDYQDFNVLSANHINNVEGYYMAHAYGNDNNVAMNLKSVGSMYVWSEATNPYSSAPLQGSLIEQQVRTTQSDVLKTQLYLGVNTNGLATMSNSNIWGWTNGETGTSSTNYGGGTRTVTVTGAGTVQQNAFGATGVTFNGFTFGAGTVSMIGDFTGGMSGTYAMTAQ